VRYHGILAPCASGRDQVVPAGATAIAVAGCEPMTAATGPIEQPPSTDLRSAHAGLRDDAPGVGTSGARDDSRDQAPPGADPHAVSNVDLRDFPPDRTARHRHRWAELLQRVFGIDALRCPRCGSTLRLIAAIEDPDVARKILEWLNLPARAPPLDPAAAIAIPPEPATPDQQWAWDFDQSPAYENTDPF